jgi:hypothetical protein
MAHLPLYEGIPTGRDYLPPATIGIVKSHTSNVPFRVFALAAFMV